LTWCKSGNGMARVVRADILLTECPATPAVVAAAAAEVVGSAETVTLAGSWRGAELRGPRRCLLGRVVRRASTLTTAYSISDVKTNSRQTIIQTSIALM